MTLLRKACELHGQRGVARLIGKSPATVNLMLKGRYPNPKNLLKRVEEVFLELKEEVQECPLLGVIHIDVCVKYQGWAKEQKVHRDRLYMQVREYCKDCKGSKR